MLDAARIVQRHHQPIGDTLAVCNVNNLDRRAIKRIREKQNFKVVRCDVTKRASLCNGNAAVRFQID